MRVLALVLGFVSVTVMAQTAPLQKLPPPPPPPPPTAVLRGATADTISVPINVLEGLAVSEPDISARDEAPQPGIVSLRVLVSKTGTVEEVAVQLGQGELPRVAVAGVKGWTYRPYLVDGQPREIQSTILLYFRDGVGKRMPAVAGMGGVAGMSGLGAPAPVVARAPGPDGRVRISSGVVQGLAIKQVAPIYPPLAKAAHMQGVVVLHAILSKTGDIEDLTVISGPPLLAQAAVDAVQQWKYRPYLLAGNPVEVETTINVNFTFATSPKPASAEPTGAAPANPPPATAPPPNQ